MFGFVFSQPQEESIEEVIKDTECLFKSREKEYQETIDQIEVRAQRSHQIFREFYVKKKKKFLVLSWSWPQPRAT